MCSCDKSLVTVAFLWEKLPQPQSYKNLTKKTAFLEGWSWFKYNNLGLALGTNLKLYISEAKGLKLQRELEEGRGREFSPALFSKKPIIYGLNFSIKMQLLRVLRNKTGDFSLRAKFLSRVMHDYSSKCPNSTKTPLP